MERKDLAPAPVPAFQQAHNSDTVDTDPSKLGIQTSDSSPSRVSGIVAKVDQLGRSIGEKATDHSRLFSLSRKGKDKALESPSQPDATQSMYATRSARKTSRLSSPSHRSSSTTRANPNDVDPFIRPPSPLTRPSIQSWKGDGSMRAGVGTLIQALQAIPWDKGEGDEDGIHHPQLLSDDEDDSSDEHMASSIHTIHRPVARSRRTGLAPTGMGASRIQDNVPEEDLQDEQENEDFEAALTPRIPHAPQPHHLESAPQIHRMQSSRIVPTRTGSMATVRVQRRAKLAEKLKEVFELDGINEVWAEMPCWLLRSVLLQGYMYLTNSYLCFFAHMPSREDQVLKSGSLNKKAQRTKRWIKHWFVLKNDALAWYQSSSDPYFPHGIVDLRYAISCDPYGEKDLRLRTNQKTITLSADSVPSREEWVKAIRKVIFHAQNSGDSVKIAIPYSAILDVEKSSAMDFSETIEVKVFDKEEQEHYSVDSYFFAYFHDLPGALDEIRDAVRAHRTMPDTSAHHTLLDTTVHRAVPEYPTSPVGHMGRMQSAPAAIEHSAPAPPPRLSGFSLGSLLRPFHDSTSSSKAVIPPLETEEFTHITKRSSASFVPITESPGRELTESQQSLTPTVSTTSHTYPPSTSSSSAAFSQGQNAGAAWSVVPSWLKTPSRKVFGSSLMLPSAVEERNTTTSPTGVREVYTSAIPPSGSRLGNDLGFSVLETPEVAMDDEATEKFHAAFAFDERETLLGHFPGYFYRLLPVSGRLYISTNHLCFKSSGPLATRTKMILPIRDMITLEKTKSTRFGAYGLVVIIKGHEELFFEFGAEDRRAVFVSLMNQQMEDVRKRLAMGDPQVPSQGKREALVLEEFEPKSDAKDDPLPDVMTESLPAVMFTSASSTFLTFKPKESMHFTFLTIGSRGDVQPYIALSKGLMEDGHRVRIATHLEFKDWILDHGIEYGYVGGDPAELMRICVENGMFTISFMTEALQKFRGWLDDLLATSWEACQGTDVLIESPSAMGGYHIAEALGIPYFRAFTMTWSRTRAYPHAFAVPDHKMGGGYNYMSYVMFDQVFWRATAGQINRWRREVMKIGSTNLDKMEQHKIPFLYNFSPAMVPPPLDWPEWIRVTGFWTLDESEGKVFSPPKDLVKFIDSAHKKKKKIVYIGFGSIVVSDPKAMTRCVIEAVVQSGVHAILSKGWSDRLHVKTGDETEAEEPLPKQIYSIQSIPHEWLFQQIDAACHHGGAGTTGASLRAGLPTIIRPFFGDQFFWADRVEALGVGTGVRKLTVDHLTDALILATTDEKQIDRARLLGEQMRKETGVKTAIESIYRDMEYAKSLIKKQPFDEDEDIEEEKATLSDKSKHRLSSISTTSTPDHASSSQSSAGSARHSEDWSVISEQGDGKASRSSSASRPRSTTSKKSPSKRHSLSAVVKSVLPGRPASSGSPISSPKPGSSSTLH